MMSDNDFITTNFHALEIWRHFFPGLERTRQQLDPRRIYKIHYNSYLATSNLT